jgi:hypothetical protein
LLGKDIVTEIRHKISNQIKVQQVNGVTSSLDTAVVIFSLDENLMKSKKYA